MFRILLENQMFLIHIGKMNLPRFRRFLLRQDLQFPVNVIEIVDAGREYVNTIFRNDFCVDWGIKRYRLPSS
jgi:hypothetical protein